jgi:hypothetical protein
VILSDTIEHTVDETGAILVAVALGELDCFVDDYGNGNVLFVEELPSAQT